MLNEYIIIIPAYNEAENILLCLKSLYVASEFAKWKYHLKFISICLNGCTDNTEEIVLEFKKDHPKLNINILITDKGMNKAIGRIISTIKENNLPIVKVDADVEVKDDSIFTILEELENHDNLYIVGAHPLVKGYLGKNLYKRILSNILDIRSKYPLSQIAIFDVTKFHQTANKYPQSAVLKSFELRSRIFFHGRFYIIRNKNLWTVPANRIGDDTYLTLDIYKKFGYDSIRIRYDALCFYKPTVSLMFHWKTYKRIFCDTNTLFELPEFTSLGEIKKLEGVKLDWKYINSLSLKIRGYFVAYMIIKRIDNILFSLFPKYNDSLWTYKTK